MSDSKLPGRPVSESEVVLTVHMELEHSNLAGNVHGGAIMRLVDTAAGIAAARHCGRLAVTAAMDDMSFMEPVYLGDILTVKAMVNEAWGTSMEVGVRVEAENYRSGRHAHTSSAYLVFVALGDDGKPSGVPPALAETDEQRERQQDDPLRPRQDADRGTVPGRLGPGPGVADQEGTGGCDEDQDRTNLRISGPDQIDQDAPKNDDLGVAIERRIEKPPKFGDRVCGPRNRAVQHVEGARQQEKDATPARMVGGDHQRNRDIQQQTEDGQTVRAQSEPGQNPTDTEHRFTNPLSNQLGNHARLPNSLRRRISRGSFRNVATLSPDTRRTLAAR